MKNILKKGDALININLKEDNPVDARELYTFLETKSKFADWIRNRIKEYGFIENQDFVAVSKILENGGRTIEYAVTLDMAKELSMVERNKKGREVRRYFIEIEKEYRKMVKVLTSSDYDAFYLRFLHLLETAREKVGTNKKLAEILGMSINAYYMLKASPHKAKVSGASIMRVEEQLLKITGEDKKQNAISKDKKLSLMHDISKIKDEDLRFSLTEKVLVD